MNLEMIHRCGAIRLRDGSTQWRVWAPRASRVSLVLLDGPRRRSLPMQPVEHGFFEHVEKAIPEGQRYFFRLDDGPDRPDPASRFQPEGVHGPSAVVVTDDFVWTDERWSGVKPEDLVLYELHVGTFTPEGTFEAIIPRLETLRDLGVTAIELMPVGQFPGTRNWGYDGVFPYAAQNSYGGPHLMQRLIDACHTHGLALFLDVVYNHLGPEGNYLAEFGPYFTDRYRTPWGQAFNYDGEDSDAVRDYVLENVRMWLEEFHVDGLRLDAVHAIFDLGARHILREIRELADEISRRAGRAVHVIAESNLNDPRIISPVDRGGHGLDGQWADDFHHAVHTFLTGERRGYYEDYGDAGQIARVLETPFLYAGDYSSYRRRRHGAPAGDLTGERFVVSIQNHDQVGNRAQGDRLSTLLDSPAKLRLAASLLLLSPYVPLLFMGEEYGEENPFPFFCSFGDPGLINAVRQGRSREFAEFAWQGAVPDPDAQSTFASARLSWSWPEGTARAGLRRLYADLLGARRSWPALRNFRDRSARLLSGTTAGSVLRMIRGNTLCVFFNLTGEPQPVRLEGSFDPEGPLFSSEASRYHGARQKGDDLARLVPYECVAYGVLP